MDPLYGIISDLPNELTTFILREVLKSEPVTDLINVPHELQAHRFREQLQKTDCLNRFTRYAKVLRRVCRTWKRIVDQPWNYWARVTAITLDIENHLSLQSLSGRLDAMSSLVSIRLFEGRAISRWGKLSNPRYEDPQNLSRFLKTLALEVTRLGIDNLNSHLLEIGLFSRYASEIDIPVRRFIGTLGTLMGRSTSEMITRQAQIDTLFELSESLETHGIPRRQTFEEIIESISFLHRLSLKTGNGRFIETPRLGVYGLSLVPFAQFAGLRELSLDQSQVQDLDNQPSTLAMDSLVYLHLKADPVVLFELLQRIECNGLEHLVLSMDWSPDHHEWGIPKDPMRLPDLKSLVLENFRTNSLAVLAAVDIPSELECLRFSVFDQWYNVNKEVLKNIKPPEHSIVPLKRIRTRRLEISALARLCAWFFKLYPGIELIRDLRLRLPEDWEARTFEPPNFEAPFRSLQSLSIQTENFWAMSLVLADICTGGKLNTLEIYPYLAREKHISSGGNGWTAWEAFVLQSTTQEKYSIIRTYIMSWPVGQSSLTGQWLLDLVPRARTLVFRYFSSGGESLYADWNWEWPLVELDPVCSEHYGRGVRCLSLESVVVDVIERDDDGRPPDTIDTIEQRFRPIYEERLPALLASRVAGGAKPIRTVTLRAFSKWDVPEVREFPQACGVLLRFEAVDDKMAPFKYDQV